MVTAFTPVLINMLDFFPVMFFLFHFTTFPACGIHVLLLWWWAWIKHLYVVDTAIMASEQVAVTDWITSLYTICTSQCLLLIHFWACDYVEGTFFGCLQTEISSANTTVTHTYPWTRIFDVDISSFINKLSHFVQVTLSSSHVQGWQLMETAKVGHKTESKNFSFQNVIVQTILLLHTVVGLLMMCDVNSWNFNKCPTWTTLLKDIALILFPHHTRCSEVPSKGKILANSPLCTPSKWSPGLLDI